MSRAIRQENDGTVTNVGSWTGIVDNTADGQRWEFATTFGATATKSFAIAPNSGITGLLMTCMARSDSTRDASIIVTGTGESGTPIPWNQWNNQTTAVDAQYNLPRKESPAYFFTGPDSAAKTVKLQAGSSGITTLDNLELFTAESQVAGRQVSFGHSVPFGVTTAANWQSLTTQRFPALFAAYLNSIGYLGSIAWADVNQNVPSEDFTSGSYLSGNSPAYIDLTNNRYVNNAGIYVPGWLRAQRGNLWPSPAPGVGSVGTNWTVAGNYMPGVAQWWAQRFALGMFMHNINDRNLPYVYDVGGAVPVANRDLAGHATAAVAGPGYTIESYKSRLRGILYRAILNITPKPLIYVLGTPNIYQGAGLAAGDLSAVFDAAAQSVVQEVRSAYSAPIHFIPLYAPTSRSDVNIAANDLHPTVAGHALIAQAMISFHERVMNQAPGFTGR